MNAIQKYFLYRTLVQTKPNDMNIVFMSDEFHIAGKWMVGKKSYIARVLYPAKNVYEIHVFHRGKRVAKFTGTRANNIYNAMPWFYPNVIYRNQRRML